MILSAQSIRRLCNPARSKFSNTDPMIYPFYERTAFNGRTFGLSSCGYDVRLDKDIWLWPCWGRLGATVEKFTMPNDVCAEVKDKSTNARKFVFVQNTVIEPGWTGYLTLELTRLLPWPIKLKAGTPIAQVMFKRLDEATAQPYSGKYMNQERGAQKARLTDQV